MRLSARAGDAGNATAPSNPRRCTKQTPLVQHHQPIAPMATRKAVRTRSKRLRIEASFKGAKSISNICRIMQNLFTAWLRANCAAFCFNSTCTSKTVLVPGTTAACGSCSTSLSGLHEPNVKQKNKSKKKDTRDNTRRFRNRNIAATLSCATPHLGLDKLY